MSLVTLFWIASWSVCGLALAILIGLLAYRGRANRHADARRVQRELYVEQLKAHTEQTASAATMASNVLTDLTVEILELVRGDEKAQFAERVANAGVAERLHARLRRGNARTRTLAAAALANFRDAQTVVVLTRALDDRNPEVRLTAALSLAVGGHAPRPDDVIRRLGIGKRETSLLSVMLLVEMAQVDPGELRMLLADPATAPTVRAAIAEALALCDDFAAVPVLASLAIEADSSASELPRYLAALATFAHPAGSPAVLHCLDSPCAEVRAAAARAAGRIGVEPALDRLERLLGDPDWWVRFHAAQALLRLGADGEQRLRQAACRNEQPAGETAAVILAEQAAAA